MSTTKFGGLVLLATAALLVFFGAGCGSVDDAANGDPDGDGQAPLTVQETVALGVTETRLPAGRAESEGFTVLFDYAPRPLRSVGTVFWIFEVRNASEADVRLTFSSGQRADVVLRHEGIEVYRWSADKAFTQAIEEVVVPPGESLPVVMNDPIGLEPGEYDAEAWLTGSLESGEEPPRVTAVVTVE